tara:strand:- start:5191 stop:7476 length:2286 start_codon:yes stop_codon:yes gene_type:complete
MTVKNKRLMTSIGNIGIARSDTGFQAAQGIGQAISDVGQTLTQSLRRNEPNESKHPDYQNYQLRYKRNEFDKNGKFDETAFLTDLNANTNLSDYEKAQLRNTIIGDSITVQNESNKLEAKYIAQDIITGRAAEIRGNGLFTTDGKVVDISAYLSDDTVKTTMSAIKEQLGEDVYNNFSEADLKEIEIHINQKRDVFRNEISNVSQKLSERESANKIENAHKITFREDVASAKTIEEILTTVKNGELELASRIQNFKSYILGTQSNKIIEDIATGIIISGTYTDKPLDLRKAEIKDIISLLDGTKPEIFIDGKSYTAETMFQDNYIEADSYIRLEAELNAWLENVEKEIDLENTIEILSKRTVKSEDTRGGVQLNTTVDQKNMTSLDDYYVESIISATENSQNTTERNSKIVSWLLTSEDGPSKTGFIGTKLAKHLYDLAEGDVTGETFLVLQNAIISLEAQSANPLNFQVGEDKESLAIIKFMKEFNYTDVYGDTPAEKHRTVFSQEPFNFNAIIVKEEGDNESVGDYIRNPSFAKNLFARTDFETFEKMGFTDRWGGDKERVRNVLAQTILANPNLKDYIDTAIMTQLRLKIGVDEESIGKKEFDEVINKAMDMFADNFRLDENNINGVSSVYSIIPENFANDEFQNIKKAVFNRDLFTGENGELTENFTPENIKFEDVGLFYDTEKEQFVNTYHAYFINPESGVASPLYNENNQNLLLYEESFIESLPKEITPEIEDKIRLRELRRKIMREMVNNPLPM